MNDSSQNHKISLPDPLSKTIERVASEELPEGLYFAKLTINNWKDYNGQKFRLYQGKKIVYGNQIEPPAHGFPLEYRNIPVTSRLSEKFTLNIDSI